MDRRRVIDDCLTAFKNKDYNGAVRLLPLLVEQAEKEFQLWRQWWPLKTVLSRYTISIGSIDPWYNGDIKAGLLHLSSRNGWLDVTRKLIERYQLDPLEGDNEGNTSLHYAAAGNQLEVMQYYFSRAWRMQRQHVNHEVARQTLCRIAAANGSLNVIKYLIEQHHTKQTDNRGRTVLHYGAKHISIVKYLITECKCDPMVIDNNNKTVLHYAVQEKCLDVVEYLVSVNPVDKVGNTFLHLAAKSGSNDVIKQLKVYEKCNPEATNRFGQRVLHCAVEHISIVKYLITECKCDPMVTDKDGKTVLHYAVQEKCLDVVEYLVSINPMNKDGNTFLHLAAKSGSYDVVTQLIVYNECNPEAANWFGQTVLHCAVEHISIVKYLITECKCDPMVTDEDGKTVLHYAAENINVVDFLITECNCDPMVADKDGKTVLHYAFEKECPAVVDYLVLINPVDKDGNTFLHLAAKNGSYNVVKQLIGYCKCNPEAANWFGQKVLHCAVEHISIVKYLITECKCDPMVTDKDGKTVLHYAFDKECSAVVEYLVSINRVDKDGNTFLHLAAKSGSYDVVTQLIVYNKCNPGATNKFGQKVLHCAVEHISIVKYLITECKCDPMVTDKDGKTVLHYAFEKECPAVVDYLVLINPVDKDGNTFLHLAAKTDSNDVVKHLIVYNECNPEATNKFGQTVLHCAVKHISIVKYLITEHKCDPMVNDKDGKTVFHYAFEKKCSAAVVEYLLSIKQVDKDGNTILHLAAKTGSYDIIEQLIGDYECNPEATNRFGQTVLHCAVEHISIVKYLITKSKCNPMVTDKDGKTVLHYAVQLQSDSMTALQFSAYRWQRKRPFSDVIEYLLSINRVDKDRNTFLHLAAKTGSYDVVKQLIGNYKCYSKATNRFGQRVLHCAAEHIGIVKYLITEYNCNPMVTDKYGKTVLHYAAEHLNVVEYLITKWNCNPMATDKDGKTVLHYASEHINVVEYLITKCNCNPMATDKDGKTVLHYAFEKKCSAVVKYLVSINQVDKDRNTFLHLAAKTGSYDVVKQLIRYYKCNPEATNRFGQGVLHCAVEHISIVKYLITECNCNPMVADKDGKIVLHYAFEKECSAVVDYLVSINQVDEDRNTFLHLAAKTGLYYIVKQLIVYNICNPEATNWFGQTVLHCAVEHISIVKYLITECKCDPMVTDEDGKTVLHYAVEKECSAVVDYLVLINPVDKDGNTFLHLAAKTGSYDVIKQLIGYYKCNPEAANWFGQKVLHCAVEHISIVKYLITECKCDPMVTDKDGKTVLHYAFDKECSAVVEYLVSINRVDKDGNTFLHLAAKSGSYDVVTQLIVYNKCNPGATNKFGQNVLYCAVEHISIVKYLITKCKCDPMVTEKDGKTVLHYAFEKKCSAVVKYLVSINQVDKDRNTFLHLAAKTGSYDIIEQLIGDYKCNPEATNRLDQRVLHCAVEHISIVKYLITKYKCDPMVTDKDGKTVLHYAFEKKCSAVVKYLVSINRVDKDRNTFLHLAAKTGSHDIIEQLIGDYECNPEATNRFGQGVLHCAAEHISIVDYLITERKCDPMVTDKDGKTVLHYAVEKKCSAVVKYLVSINRVDKDKNTFLHLAAKTGSYDVVKQLIRYYKCNPEATNRFGQGVLHCAVEHISIVKCLITECNCNPMVTDKDGKTVLHYAVKKKCSAVVKYLVSINRVDKDKNTFLHLAAKTGSYDVVKQLIGYYKCNPEATNRFGRTALHCAVEYINVVKYLIIECNCDPMVTDKDGKSVLHYAVEKKCLDVVEYLLSTGKCDPVAKDKMKKTPLQLTDEDNQQKIQSLFKKFGQVKTSHPVDSYVNVLLLGNPGAGKSTLSKVINDTNTGSIVLGSMRNVKGVEPCTAGIIPYKLQHKTLGNIILHDFAGHSEYYSSHGAVIENLLQGSGGVFLIVVNILEKRAVKQLHQWLTVLRNEEQKALDQCHIIVVVSHVDEISDPVERRKRKEEIQEIIGRKKCKDYAFLDCRKLGGSSVDSLLNKLSKACESIRSTSKRNSSLYCHMMYGLLEERKENILTLSDVMSAAKDNNSYALPDEREEVLDVLHSLDSIGLIKVLKSDDKVWVVVNKGILLSELDGILFAPEIFKEHVDIASNTGIVSVSGLTRLFPDYDSYMLICFLQNMELCQEMNPSFLKMTNLIPLESEEEEGDTERRGERLLFFPCLLYSGRPDEITSQVYQFGWSLQCTGEHHFFPPRYFHVLSLNLAFKLALPQEDDKLSRRCTFWKNGLYWSNSYGVGVLVEIVDESQCVLVLMSCEEGYNMVELRRKVIGEVMSVYEKSCPSLEVKELVIDPKELDYPVNTPRERTVYTVKDVISHVGEVKPFIVSDTGIKQKEVKSILPDESLVDINKLSLLGGRDIKV